MKHLSVALAALVLLASPLFAARQEFLVIISGAAVGSLSAETEGDTTRIAYDYKNNGRGPTVAETVTVDAAGLPVRWTIAGSTTFGSRIDEEFRLEGDRARWRDATGPGEARLAAPALYVGQGASPWAYGLYARALDRAGGTLPALPGGTLRLERQAALQLAGRHGPVPVTAFIVSGIELEPATIFLDGEQRLVAFATPAFITIARGLEAEEERLRRQVAAWDTARLAEHQRQLAHRPAGPLRIANVRLFDPDRLALSAPASVLVEGNRIRAIAAPGTRRRGETVVDGEGGTLIAGFHEMHAHLGQSAALANLLAGITTVRDMGNDDAVLDRLVASIEAGELAGPRVVRSGFIEGKSATNNRGAVVVDSEAAAVAAVADAARRGVFQIKIYSSIDPAWVPAMVAEARRHGLNVAGHIPAFTTTDAMLEAGYNEITHSNQLMLNWVLQPGDDTRTLLRITALKRLADVDLAGPAPQRTLALMKEKGAAHDPTLIIMETAMRGRKGRFPPGAESWGPRMPIGVQRNLKQPMLAIETAADDAAYNKAFDVTLDYMRMLNEAGILILPGTDMGGSFWYHRELELFTRFGMSNAEILRRATLDSARYMKRDDRYGAIRSGMVADLVLLQGDPVADIRATQQARMVVKDGVVYFPAEGYQRLGIQPLATRPPVAGAGLLAK